MEGKVCIICGAYAPNRCSGCIVVRYCSKEHQAVHWNEHKLNCKPYQMEWDSNTGHHLVASRDIEAGAVILQEKPLMVAPKQVDGPAICVGCCCKLEGQGVGCPKCNWPMCGKPECWSEGSHHALGECSNLSKTMSEIANLWTTKGIYQCILIKRCIALSTRDPIKWKKLEDLKYSGLNEWTKELLRTVRPTVEELVNNWAPDKPNVRDWMVHFCGVFLFNSFELPALEDIRSEGLLALYSTASLIDHNCMANAIKTFTKDGKIIIRAAVPISKGSNITLNFTKTSLFTGTFKRQIELEKTKFNVCHCDRCKDPTELGTYASALVCLECPNERPDEKEGILLPKNPLDKNGFWYCNKCPSIEPARLVLKLMNKMEEKWAGVDRKSIADCELFINQHSHIFPPQHHFITELKLAICNIYAEFHEKLSSFNIESIHKKEVIADELLNILNITSPGLNHLRGHLLYASRNHINLQSLFSGITSGSIKVVQPSAVVTLNVLQEVINIFSLDPDGSYEGSLRKKAIQKKKDLKFYSPFINMGL